MSWALIEKARRQLQRESGPLPKDPGGRLRFCLAYPNTYFVGMSNLGMHVLYRRLNADRRVSCERVFAPSPAEEEGFRRTGTPLFSLETQTALAEFDAIGFSLQFEEDYVNVVQMLDLAGIEVFAEDRAEGDPLILAGGPCATFNPMPLAEIIDAFVLGDGEPVLPELIDALYAGTSVGCERRSAARRSEVLKALSVIPGIEVSSEIRNPKSEIRNPREHSPAKSGIAHSVIMTPDTEFANTLLIEVSRGCVRQCRFCVTGNALGSARFAPPEDVLAVVNDFPTKVRKVGLLGAMVSDCPGVERVATELADRGISVSISSLRAETATPELLRAVAESGQRSFTIAPECGTERLRRRVAKLMSDQSLLECARTAAAVGLRRAKLYFIVGLPGETEDDVQAIPKLVRQVASASGISRVTVSVNPFIPKPQTPFQWEPMAPMELLKARFRLLASEFRREQGVTYQPASLRLADLQCLLARGDHRLGRVIAAVSRTGGTRAAWQTAMEKHGVHLEAEVFQPRDREKGLPWDVLQAGPPKDTLWRSRTRALGSERDGRGGHR